MTWEQERDERNAKIDAAIADFSMVATYLPQDLSTLEDSRGVIRRSDLSEQQLKYHVTLSYKGRAFVESSFQMGIGHIPYYTQGLVLTVGQWNEIKLIFKTGKCARNWPKCVDDRLFMTRNLTIEPTLRDVLHCLMSDGDAINYLSFEDWADNFGYDKDSRKAEKIYQACLQTGLTFRNSIGEKKLAELRDIYQDY